MMNKNLLLRKINTFTRRPDKLNLLDRQIKKWGFALRGIDFLQGETVKELQLNPSISNGYSASSKKYLVNILQKLNINNNSIIDFGCGKGFALYIMSRFNFSKICGVEISPKLFAIASKNLKVLRLENIKLYLMDAALFTDLDGFDIFYFFNPFPEIVLNQVLQNIIKSIKNKPRSIQIIYNLPRYENIVLNNGFYRTHQYTYGSKQINGECSVYSNTPKIEIQDFLK